MSFLLVLISGNVSKTNSYITIVCIRIKEIITTICVMGSSNKKNLFLDYHLQSDRGRNLHKLHSRLKESLIASGYPL